MYQPPMVCKFVGSSKYAPLPNLPSQTMIPSGFIYKPSWQQPKQLKAIENKPPSNNQTTNINNAIESTSSSSSSGAGNNNVPATMTTTNPKSVPPPRQLTPNPLQTMNQGPLSRPPSLPNTMGGGFNPVVMGMRPRMSPISPAMLSNPGFGTGANTPGSVHSPMPMGSFANRTSIPPPPPYDVDVAGLATA